MVNGLLKVKLTGDGVLQIYIRLSPRLASAEKLWRYILFLESETVAARDIVLNLSSFRGSVDQCNEVTQCVSVWGLEPGHGVTANLIETTRHYRLAAAKHDAESQWRWCSSSTGCKESPRPVRSPHPRNKKKHVIFIQEYTLPHVQ
jgi:hypothetical protein